MIKTLTAFVLVLGFTSQAHSEDNCAENDYIRAEYDVKISSEHKRETNIQLILWRKGNTVAHQHPATHITETWHKVANKKDLIKPTRYFEEYKRAIEYQAGDVVRGQKQPDWSYRSQLVSDKLLKSLELNKQEQQGCEAVQYLSQIKNNNEIILEWLPETRLVQLFKLKDKNHTETWTLKNISHDKSAVVAYFKELEEFQTTDYADIGDDHTDPFLTKMVTLGFIQEGASGFYDDKGNALAGEHHH